jgi:hypothetical protein
VREPFEAGRQQHVAGVEVVDHSAELGTADLGSARYFAEHFARAVLPERRDRSIDALAVGRYPRIPKIIALFCTKILQQKSNRIKGLILVRFSLNSATVGRGTAVDKLVRPKPV